MASTALIDSLSWAEMITPKARIGKDSGRYKSIRVFLNMLALLLPQTGFYGRNENHFNQINEDYKTDKANQFF
jgi:hypothetical protein